MLPRASSRRSERRERVSGSGCVAGWRPSRQGRRSRHSRRHGRPLAGHPAGASAASECRDRGAWLDVGHHGRDADPDTLAGTDAPRASSRRSERSERVSGSGCVAGWRPSRQGRRSRHSRRHGHPLARHPAGASAASECRDRGAWLDVGHRDRDADPDTRAGTDAPSRVIPQERAQRASVGIGVRGWMADIAVGPPIPTLAPARMLPRASSRRSERRERVSGSGCVAGCRPSRQGRRSRHSRRHGRPLARHPAGASAASECRDRGAWLDVGHRGRDADPDTRAGTDAPRASSRRSERSERVSGSGCVAGWRPSRQGRRSRHSRRHGCSLARHPAGASAASECRDRAAWLDGRHCGRAADPDTRAGCAGAPAG